MRSNRPSRISHFWFCSLYVVTYGINAKSCSHFISHFIRGAISQFHTSHFINAPIKTWKSKSSQLQCDIRTPWFSPDSPNLEKVHSMSKCSCFVKKSYYVILSLRNIPSMQNYVLLIFRRALREKRAKVFARLTQTHECRKISNLIQHTRNVATAQNYNSRKFGLKCNWRYRVWFFRRIGFPRIGKTPTPLQEWKLHKSYSVA